MAGPALVDIDHPLLSYCGSGLPQGSDSRVIVIFKSFIASDGEMISMNHTMPGEFIQFYG